MAEKIKKTVKPTDSNVMLCLLFLVLGVLFVWQGAGIIGTAMMIIGVILTVLGLFELFNQNWIMGIIEVILGVALIVIAATVGAQIMLLLLGIAILLFAVIVGVLGFKNFKGMATVAKVLFILTILLAVTVGVLFIVAYVEIPQGLFIAIGAISLAVGVVMLVKAALTSGRKTV